MESLKKLALIITGILCIFLVISPVDLLTGVSFDDVVYAVMAFLSFRKSKMLKSAA